MESLIKRNNLTIKGKGTQPMLFVHGYGCNQSMWRFITPAFESDYKIILMDLTGFGQSDASAFSAQKYHNLERFADDIIEICESLSFENTILVGHSVSAMICMLAANKKPSLFSSLVLVSPSPRYINDDEYIGGFSKEDIDELLDTLDSNYLGWSTSMSPVIMGNDDRPELGEELTNSFCNTDPSIAKHFARLTFLSDNRDDLQNVKIPSLILQCSNDVIAPEVVGRYVHSKIPNSTFRLMKATGHCPNLSAPEETTKFMKEFLND